MLLYHYEKKGIWVLTSLILCLLVLPRQFLRSRNNFFLLEEIVLPDTNDLLLPEPEEKIVLELNETDSNSLIKIKGIGPYYAHRILSYRKRLGGFYTVRQLKELNMTYFNVDSSAHLFRVNPGLIRKKDLNTLSFKEILRHPYLEYEDVVLLFQAKKKYGKINCDTLEKRKILPFYKLKKIKPYFR